MPMTISIDDELKADFSAVCRDIGITPSAAMAVFAKAVVRERAIPFVLTSVSSQERAAEAYDRYVSDGIRRGMADFASGDVLTREESRALIAARGALS